jgi:hypothetical protein
MWMNANEEVLSCGRKHRFHTEVQRLAAIVEQKHCQHDSGCTVPGYLYQMHHEVPWSQGGETSLREAKLLCPFHHSLEHAAAPRSHPTDIGARGVMSSGARTRLNCDGTRPDRRMT